MKSPCFQTLDANEAVARVAVCKKPDGKAVRASDFSFDQQWKKLTMRLKIKISKALILAATMGVMAASTAPALPPSKTGEWKPIDSAKEAKALPKSADVILACAGCKTIRPVDRKGIDAWFSAKVKHDCAACGGKLKFTGAVPGKSPGAPAEYVHTCSHCGKVSAYLCARH